MSKKIFLCLGAMAILGACSDDDVSDPGASIPNVVLNSVNGAAYAALGATPTAVAIGDPSNSTAWDIAVNGIYTKANGGSSGPGGVSVYCLCQNESKTDAQILALTAHDGVESFNSVTAADIPADDDAFEEDEAQVAIAGWYNYSGPPDHIMSAKPEAVFALRLGSTAGQTAKFRVTDIVPGSGRTAPIDITFDWALGPLFSETQSLTVSANSEAPQYVNLTTGTVSSTPTGNWDLKFSGTVINVNTGANVAAALMTGMTWDAFDIEGMPAAAWKTDETGGVFDTKSWYRYDIDPTAPHRVTMTYNVYLVKKGADVYKVQFANYYHPQTGDPRHITLRAEKLQ